MPYITIKQSPIYHQITFEEMMAGVQDLSKYISANTSNTRTFFVERLNPKLLEHTDIDCMIELLAAFNRSHQELFNADRAALYKTFYIPKNSGGLRRIDAPEPQLMGALRQLKALFEENMFALYHTSAFAYVRGRCTVDAIKRHQGNESKWFIKLDFTNFFGSTTLDFVISMFSMIFPFSQIMTIQSGREALTRAISLSFLNGGLPQGTPISPFITNVMMIPIDHKLSNSLRDFERDRFVYTRYADDLLISSKHDFDKDKIQEHVVRVLREFNAPFTIKPEKTRYGSSSGRNWNLGVMLNKDNQITIGHKKKKQFKAMLDNYVRVKKSGRSWDTHDVQVISGLISYYRMIERDYIDYVIGSYSAKNGFDIMGAIKADLSV